ncbi:hypothetical protein DRW42_09635 [Pedobacter miscanthi]|uniref:Uncharacterized protein n=1 Tax=Pedobacter miscanthi TaxID=2259170 RepID=A0A366L1Z0_9SPHI|nr:hypothetical protein DRW42_09635 [Pedobacter miscanthi]
MTKVEIIFKQTSLFDFFFMINFFDYFQVPTTILSNEMPEYSEILVQFRWVCRIGGVDPLAEVIQCGF